MPLRGLPVITQLEIATDPENKKLFTRSGTLSR